MSDIDIIDMDLPFDEGEDLINVHMYDIDSEMIPEEESGQTDCSSEDESVDSEPDEEDTRCVFQSPFTSTQSYSLLYIVETRLLSS